MRTLWIILVCSLAVIGCKKRSEESAAPTAAPAQPATPAPSAERVKPKVNAALDSPERAAIEAGEVGKEQASEAPAEPAGNQLALPAAEAKARGVAPKGTRYKRKEGDTPEAAAKGAGKAAVENLRHIEAARRAKIEAGDAPNF